MQGAVAGRDAEMCRVLLLGDVGAVAGRCCNPRLRAAIPDSELRRVLLQGAAAGRVLLQGETQELRRALSQGAAAGCCCRVLGRRVLLQGVLGAAACRDSKLRRVLLQGAAAGCCCARCCFRPRLRIAEGRDAECRSCCRLRFRVAQGAAAGQVARGAVAAVKTSAD